MNLPVNETDAIGNLLAYLNNEMELSVMFNSTIAPMLKAERVLKTRQLLKRGDTARTAYWLERSYGRAYRLEITDDGLETQRTVEFYKPGEIMVDAAGFFSDVVSDCCIEVAAGSVLVPFRKEDFALLKLSAPETGALAKRILAKQGSNYVEKMAMLRLPCEERVARFKELFGIQVWHAFAQKHIASYLGMTPEHLSRLF